MKPTHRKRAAAVDVQNASLNTGNFGLILVRSQHFKSIHVWLESNSSASLNTWTTTLRGHWMPRSAMSRPMQMWIGELYFAHSAAQLIGSSRCGVASQTNMWSPVRTDDRDRRDRVADRSST